MKIDNYVINWSYAFQHSRPKTIRGHANVMSFPEKPSICPVLSLKDYLVRTAPLHAVDAKHMFIQLRKPYKSVSSQTLAHWITSIMADAGVDTTTFHQHSTHSASAAWLVWFQKKNVCGPDLQTRSMVQSHHHIQEVLSQSSSPYRMKIENL